MDKKSYVHEIGKLKAAIGTADALVIGAGAGLSTAAGLTYSGERFERYFGDFIEKYHFTDMYSAGFYPFHTLEEQWAYWARHIWCNRYVDAPKDTYDKLQQLIENAEKDFFVITTNVDHRFQLAGFPKERLFYTQGDYGLWQCGVPCHTKTYDNHETVRQMMEAQGFEIGTRGRLSLPEGDSLAMRVPSELVPHCPVCGEPMSMNLRADDTFVEDEGWHEAAGRYHDFIEDHQKGSVVYLELGVGGNTPVIIKYPFWRYTHANPKSTYACVNYGEAYVPPEIRDRSVALESDIDQVLEDLLRGLNEQL